MQTLQELCLIAKWKWLFDWIESLDAENHHPAAYVVASICLLLVIAGIVAAAVECRRCMHGKTTWQKASKATVPVLLFIGIPATIFWALASKLLA